MTLAQWEAREDLQKQLAQLLETDPLKSALELILDAEMAFPVASPTVELTAIKGANRDGVFRAIRILKKLSNPTKPLAETLKPWGHIK